MPVIQRCVTLQGLSAIQEAELLVHSCPHTPDMFALLTELSAQEDFDTPAEAAKLAAEASEVLDVSFQPMKVCSHFCLLLQLHT